MTTELNQTPDNKLINTAAEFFTDSPQMETLPMTAFKTAITLCSPLRIRVKCCRTRPMKDTRLFTMRVWRIILASPAHQSRVQPLQFDPLLFDLFDGAWFANSCIGVTTNMVIEGEEVRAFATPPTIRRAR